ncbi:MAG: tetratricopeptide repeat protein, partial [Chitinophagaceae bacterium]
MLKQLYLKTVLFSCITLFFMPVARAQNDQDLKKMMDEAKKMIDSDKDMDPAVKKQMLQFMNSSKVQNGISVAQKEYHPAIELTSLPKRDERRLAAIPAKVMSGQEAAQYILRLSDKIEKQLSETDRNNAKKIQKETGNDIAISNEGIISWYDSKPKLALCLAAKSAVKTQNLTGINNLAAMLNIMGYEEKAVPLLQYALNKDDSSSLLLNNLGRAYLGLGDKRKAEQYYLRCIAVAPSHPEANNALGCLYEESGDPVKAAEHFEKSIEGAFNEEAYRHLKKLKPQTSIVILVKKRHKAPEYFNQFRFQVPGECYTYMDYYKVKAEHESFQRSISALSNEYASLRLLHEEKSHKEIEKFQKNVFNSLAKREMVQCPIHAYPFALIAAQAIIELQTQGPEILAQFKKDYEKNIRDLGDRKAHKDKMIAKEYEAQYKFDNVGECTNCCINCEEVNRARCKALEESAINFQADAAAMHKEYVDKSRLQLTGYFDDMIYWFALLG